MFWALLWTSLCIKMENMGLLFKTKILLRIVLCKVLSIIFLIKCVVGSILYVGIYIIYLHQT